MTRERYAVVGISHVPYLHILLECGASEHVHETGAEYSKSCRHFLLPFKPTPDKGPRLSITRPNLVS